MNGAFDFSWMAWTWPTAAFFIFIAISISCMAIWEYFSPGGGPRSGILGIQTTRGDRLFISLLGGGFIHLAWLGFMGTPLWGALVISVVFAVAIFKWA